MLTYQWEEYETSSDPRSKKEKSNSKFGTSKKNKFDQIYRK
jgi:hypothetical protein